VNDNRFEQFKCNERAIVSETSSNPFAFSQRTTGGGIDILKMSSLHMGAFRPIPSHGNCGSHIVLFSIVHVRIK
jgi:hypothetical protein